MLGPVLVFGSAQDRKATLERERSEAETTETAPPAAAEEWGVDQWRFPVSSAR